MAQDSHRCATTRECAYDTLGLPNAAEVVRPSLAFHEVPIPDLRPEDGRKLADPVTLGRWLQARGTVEVSVTDDEYAGPTDIAPARQA